jgi:hypothetical protein
MPGPGDLWGTPEEGYAVCDDCPFDGQCSTAPRFTVLDYKGCTLYQMRRRAEDESIDELINFAGPYADAPRDNDLSLHDYHLWMKGWISTARRPWWRHRTRLRLDKKGSSFSSRTCPCTPDDTDPDDGDSLAVLEGAWRPPRHPLYQHHGTTNTKHWRRRNIKPCQPTESGLIIGGVWSRP